MRKFNLSAVVTISIYTEVEAETLEEALEIAEGRHIESAEYDPSYQKKEAWISEEFDGTPCEIKEVEI